MKPRPESAPLTPEDRKVWHIYSRRANARITAWCELPWWHFFTESQSADRRDADIMLEIGWRLPGSAVVYVDIGDGQVTAHSIAGRKRREEFDRWLETEADEETKAAVLAARQRRRE